MIGIPTARRLNPAEYDRKLYDREEMASDTDRRTRGTT